MNKSEINSNSLKIKTEDIIKIVSKIAKDSYGVSSIASKDEVNLIGKITNIAKKGKKEEGIFVTKSADNTFSVSVYLMISQDVKVTEVLRATQDAIIYALKKKYPKMVKSVNVYANGLR